MYRLALKTLARRKMRTFLSSLGIMIGVAMIISLVSISDGLKLLTDDLAGTIGTNLYVVPEGGMAGLGGGMDVKVIGEIERIPGVSVVAPMSYVVAEMEGYKSAYSFMGSLANVVALTGIDPAKEKMTGSPFTQIAAGRFLRPGERDGAVIGSTLARGADKKVGDTATIIYKGTRYEFTVVGIYDTGQSESDDHFLVDLAEMQRIADVPNYMVSMVTVVPDNPSQSDFIARKIKLMIDNVNPNFAKDALDAMSGFTSTLHTVTWVIAGIAALIGGIGIANTMIMSVMEQTHDIGILKAVGWRSRDVLLLILVESLAISAIGALAGMLLGGFAVLGLLPLIFKGAFTPVLTVVTVSEAFIFALALGLLGGIIPARRAAGLDPVEAFRAE